jgi:hypothetical protein
LLQAQALRKHELQVRFGSELVMFRFVHLSWLQVL